MQGNAKGLPRIQMASAKYSIQGLTASKQSAHWPQTPSKPQPSFQQSGHPASTHPRAISMADTTRSPNASCFQQQKRMSVTRHHHSRSRRPTKFCEMEAKFVRVALLISRNLTVV
eukprot:scaffold1769_cov185-Amphora_coffeaeformis.AAC.1